MKDFWNRIGGPDAFNWVSFLLFYPIVVGANIIGSGVNLQSEGPRLILASSVSVFAVWSLVLTAKYTILRGTAKKPRPIPTMVVVILALLFRAWLFDTLLIEFGLSTQERVLYRFTASFATIGLSLLFSTYLVSLAREYSRNSRDLRLTNEALENTRDDVDGKIARKREEVISGIRKELLARLDGFKSGSARETLDNIRATIEDVVRPVSHDLDRQVADIGTFEPVTRDDRIQWSRVLANSTVGQPIRPLMFSVWSGISALLFAPRLWGFWEGVTVSVTVFVLPYLLLVLIRGFWARIASHRQSAGRALIFTGALLVLGLITATTAGFVSGLTDRLAPMILPQTLLWTLSGWVVAVLPSLRAETTRVLAELNRASAELREELVRMNTAYRLQQKAIARALHGPIQDALSVSSFKLSAALESGTASSQLVDELREMIASTLVLLETQDDEAPKLTAALEDMAELWEGVVEISWTLSKDAQEEIAAHRITAASITELVREAVSNSVRHGRASEVQIEIQVVNDRLELVVTNNGKTPGKKEQKAGLGTTLLDELTLRWERGSNDGKTTLTAVLPII